MKVEYPSPDLIPALRSLWKEAFGDSDAFLDSFFAIAYAPGRCRCIAAEDSVEAVLYWFDVSCRGQKFAYIYAVATAAAARGKGLCRALMADTAALLKESGYYGALLVPQDEGLQTMYSKMGYLPATSIDEFFCAAESTPLSIREITPEEYAALRPGALPEGSVELSSKSLAFLAAHARFYARENLLAAVSREEEHLRVLEYLGHPDVIPAFIHTLGHTEATVRTPGSGVPFAMYLPLTADCKRPDYFAFCFD